MKTYRNLYPQIASFANLEEAWRKARRGKRTKEAAARFEQNAEGELFQLERAVGISAGGINPAAARQNRLKPAGSASGDGLLGPALPGGSGFVSAVRSAGPAKPFRESVKMRTKIWSTFFNRVSTGFAWQPRV